MRLSFEWDEQKAQENLSKHAVSFEECSTIFGDPSSLTIGDAVHSIEEDRLITIGLSNRGRILLSCIPKEKIISVSSVPDSRRRGREGHMEKHPVDNPEPDMLDEYDFADGARGKYAKLYDEGTNLVLLDPDVAEVFPNSVSVNRALRALADLIRQHSAKMPS